MFFFFWRMDPSPLSPLFQRLLEVVLQLKFICSKILVKEQGQHLEKKRKAVFKETPL